MAVKTITIDMEAYKLLAAEKKDKESFSKVIKRRLKPSHTADNLLKNLDRVNLSESTLDKLEELLQVRSESMAASPRIETE